MNILALTEVTFCFLGKVLVIGVIEEFEPLEKLTSEIDYAFRESLEAIAASEGLGDAFIFGWSPALSTMNSIAMKTITPLPNLIVINSSTLEYYMPDVDGPEVTEESIRSLLNDLQKKPITRAASGGQRMHHRLYRSGFDGFTNVMNMYKGNPVLTILMFGLPLSFFSVIVYVSCCSDMLDADEEEEEETQSHPKSD